MVTRQCSNVMDTLDVLAGACRASYPRCLARDDPPLQVGPRTGPWAGGRCMLRCRRRSDEPPSGPRSAAYHGRPISASWTARAAPAPPPPGASVPAGPRSRAERFSAWIRNSLQGLQPPYRNRRRGRGRVDDGRSARSRPALLLVSYQSSGEARDGLKSSIRPLRDYSVRRSSSLTASALIALKASVAAAFVAGSASAGTTGSAGDNSWKK